MTGKRLLQYGVILVGVALLLNAAFMSVVANFNLGLVALGAFSLMLIVYGILWLKRKAGTWLHVVAITCCVAVIAFSCFLAIYGGHSTVRYNEDALIVLGAGVHGENVTAPLARRLDAAAEYFQKNPRVVIVVSGGQGPQEDLPEAVAMKRYLVAKGIPGNQILEEEKSTSTYENFLFSSRLLKQRFPEGCTIAFITNNFHVYRAARTAQAAGVSARHLGASLNGAAIPSTYLREMLAVTSMWVFGVH